MKHTTRLRIVLATILLPGTAGLAQGTSTNGTNQDIFPVHFSALCQSYDRVRGRIITSHLSDRNIVAQALGTRLTDRSVNRNFALAYNATQDSLQVVNQNLEPVLDVIHFGGGAAIADNRQIDRFTFLFFPGQTNELGAETNVFGSGVLSEGAARSGAGGAPPNISGRLQFVLTGGNVLGQTNSPPALGDTNSTGITNGVSGTNSPGMLSVTNTSTFAGTGLSGEGFVMTNADIVFDTNATLCVATFTTGRGVLTPLPPPVTGSNTNGVGGTNTLTNTNAPAGTNGNTGLGTTGMVRPTTGGTASATGTTGSTGSGATGTATAAGASGTTIGTTSPVTGIGSTVGMAPAVSTSAAGTPGSTTPGRLRQAASR